MILRKYLTLVSLLTSLFVLAGCLSSLEGYKNEIDNMQVPRLMIEARGIDYSGGGGNKVSLPVSGTQIKLEREPVVGEYDIINVDMVKVDMGLALLIQITDKGSRELYRRSVTHSGSRIVLTTNGQPIGARRLNGTIEDGQFYTFVEIPDEELGQFVIDLKASIAELQTHYKY
ncbi:MULTISPECIES: hypothetical protein [unclassified Lentimonas]|uniref:hypothetical protein n=1 Tax=unclassified Lentimonas TaxID=2630993 RepID=UPI0013273824|nr:MULTISPECIES: hypothetical protein [unclassified Lentimonas]CAA6677854.1 Unannotated [Lentimonas sp. CC4]CAA6683958.1 Unannotated [Lentimonas sp. CC6]CAA6689943.1 Unannotated [Lentimonas sp. CC10]CAA6691010.1 Unannotated [Lentimonas sp. CC19]CAA7069366.1 Unannotated [Lentimonas sp. CC11]